jgi:T4 superinfection immunity protein
MVVVAVLALMILVSLSAALYLLPLIVGIARQVPDIGAVAAVNVLLGWTFVGWVFALALALRSVSVAGPTVQIVQQLPPGSWPELGGGYRPEEAPPLMLPPGDTPDPSDRGQL